MPSSESARIRELEAEVAELRELVRPVQSRRNILKLAGAAAAGGVAAIATRGGTAAAIDPNDLDLGFENNDTAALTRANYTGAAAGATAFVFQGGTTFANAGSAHPAVLAGWANTASQPNGVYGFTSQHTGAAVLGRHNANATGGTGEDGGVGVLGESLVNGIGVRGLGLHGVHGNSNSLTTPAGAGAGVRASSTAGPNLLLDPSLAGPPTAGTWSRGSVLADTAGNLWYCVTAGTPGTWKRLASTTSAGVFHAIAPTRVYDSRAAAPAQGALAMGANRLISVADGRDLTTGAVTTANVVPAGATAVTANVTVVNTVVAGFLAINPGGDAVVKAATVNWFATGQILNNGVNLTLNNARQVTVIAGGSTGAQTDFVIDVTGYFA